MLIHCPECNKEISNKAVYCPNCGFPISNSESNITRTRKRTHRRLPNGFGQISKLKNPNLKKPYRAMVSVGVAPNGRPICKLLKPVAYFETYNEAYEALLRNQTAPILQSNLTLKQLFDKWLEYKKTEKISSKRINIYTMLFDKCKDLHDKNIYEIKPHQLKIALDSLESHKYAIDMKSLFKQTFAYAVEYGYLETNPAVNLAVSKAAAKKAKENYKGHNTFTDSEINTLWNNIDKDPFVKIILIQCYTGFRPGEMCSIKISDVDLEKRIIIGGLKTDAGRNRHVPIIKKILVLVESAIKEAKAKYTDNAFLISNYSTYSDQFHRTLDHLNITGHTPHDPRVFFITTCKNCEVNEYAIKKIVGHAIADITEGIYTKRDDSWLIKEADKISIKM